MYILKNKEEKEFLVLYYNFEIFEYRYNEFLSTVYEQDNDLWYNRLVY